MMTVTPGMMFLVVGPSGAGKDSLIEGARQRLADDPMPIIFPQRTVTRPLEAVGEDHHSVTHCEFDELVSSGAFCLHWRAHGHGYGIPGVIAHQVDNGINAVINVSRTVITDARLRFSRLRIVNVTAPPRILAQRLASRGREDADQIRSRLERANASLPGGPDVVTLDNGDDLDTGITRFVAILAEAAGDRPYPPAKG